MIKNKVVPIAVVSAFIMLLSGLIPSISKAQFEGSIIYQRSDVDTKTKQEKVIGEMELILTPDRMLLKGLDNIARMKLIGSEPTSMIVVRQDKKDFLMMDGQSKALKVSKKDLQTMSSFLSNFNSGNNNNGDQISIRSTDETATLNGYSIRKSVLWNKEKPLTQVNVWFTDELNVDWGILSESWLSESSSMFVPSFIFEHFFKKNSIPLLIQQFENDTLVSEMKATRIDEVEISAERTAVPDGLNIMGLQEYMMLKMSGN